MPLTSASRASCGRLEGADRAVAEERAQIGFVRGALGDRDLPAFQPLRGDVEPPGAAFAGEAGRRVVVAIREIDGLEQARAHRVRGNDGVRLAPPQGRDQLRPGPHLDVARRRQLQAEGARHVDVEARQNIVLVEVVEGRIVAVGEEADGHAARQRLALALLGGRRRRRRAFCASSREDGAVQSARPTKSKATAPRFVCSIFIRARSFRVQGHGHGRRRREWGAGHRVPEPIPRSILARMRRAGQRASARPRPSHSEHPYAFLVGALIDSATLERADAEARRCGVAIHDMLLAAGWISEADYAAAVAGWLGVPLVAWEGALDLGDVGPDVRGGGGPAGADRRPAVPRARRHRRGARRADARRPWRCERAACTWCWRPAR